MDTLRGLLRGLDVQDSVMSKRHRFSSTHELRRFTWPRERGKRPPTDFFELYWAHHLQKGRARETITWAARLVLWKPLRLFQQSLRPAVIIARALALVMATAALSILALALVDRDQALLVGAPIVLLVAAAALSALAGGFFRKPLADAARYLTPHPANLSGRNQIRDEGIALLRALHESGEYMRVVVIGHSLGSVIGYDVLRSLWDEYRHPNPDEGVRVIQPELVGLDEVGLQLGTSPTRRQIDGFQQAQHRLWRENRGLGVRWLVTDFVTLGSPLTHGDLLLSSGLADLRQRQREREYPVSPPMLDDHDRSSFPQLYELPGRARRSALVSSEASVFASTRWTNMYFPVRSGVIGDLVGGPLSGVFGPGILDIALRTPTNVPRWRSLFPWAHSNYWLPVVGDRGTRLDRRRRNRAAKTSLSDVTLREVLHLDLERSRHMYPAPTDPAIDRPSLVVKLGGGDGVLRRV